MRAGNLDRRITIEAISTVDDSYGYPVETWTTHATVWAEVKPLRGEERFSAQQFDAQVDTRFRIRYRGDLNPTMRIQYDGLTYDITAILEIGRREGLEILASAHVGN